jgi:hypothetical protein
MGDLLAQHVAGAPLPEHAPTLAPARYEDARYLKELESMTDSGQL